ncbi:hypothetical protein RJ639_000274 [Escallonia herrerae]|uniref:AD domain-containing protein n=2 Tax=Escallonia herrerae TaxID=1293975 RepID=A0AA89BHY6_9ASTE|nr:hypothetical protein RJ639_000274 [Escallonia herrerae]
MGSVTCTNSGLPVRWDKTLVVVMNEVRVSSPYLSESVTGGTAAANERVRKVLSSLKGRGCKLGVVVCDVFAFCVVWPPSMHLEGYVELLELVPEVLR